MKALRKFGLLDVVIIIALLLGAFILVRTMTQRDVEEAETGPIVYTFETLEVGEEFVESLNLGDTVYHSIRNEELGKIKSFTPEPFEMEYRNNETGTIDIIEKPDKYTVLIEIESTYTMGDEEKIMVGEEEIRVGKSLPLKGMGYATFGYIVKIEK